MNPLALILATAVHMLPLLSMVGCQEQKGSPPPPAEEQSQPPPPILYVQTGGTGDAPPCEHSYTGIGVWVERAIGDAERVLHVVTGGPADRAGVQVGDILISPIAIADVFDVGHLLHLRIERAGRQMLLAVRIGEVCFA